MKTGIELIAEERQEQIEKHGYTTEHDSDHDYFELTRAAICYAEQATLEGQAIWQDRLPNRWPFEATFWKPSPHIQGHPCPVITKEDAIKMLKKSGAFIAAEIDRLQNRLD